MTEPGGRLQPAQLFYDSTDQRLVVLVNGKEVPVLEPVLPGLEAVPDVRHVRWSDPVTPWAQAHLASCPECQEVFHGNKFVGRPQAGQLPRANKNP